jgi:hypothetical protein
MIVSLDVRVTAIMPHALSTRVEGIFSALGLNQSFICEGLRRRALQPLENNKSPSTLITRQAQF